MFSLLNPWFLAAGAAALVPLILHLIQRSRAVRVPFSTVRFLKLAEKRSSRRIKLEHFVLWLLRTLLMLLLAFAFALPMLRTRGFGDFLGAARREVALVIDSSFSMDYAVGNRTVWDRAVQAATAVLEGLSEQDRFCVFLADDNVTPVIEQLSGNREEGVARIKALRCGRTSSQLCAAVIAANDALDRKANRYEREIHIITDNQALPWESFARAQSGEPGQGPGGDPAAVSERTAFFVSLLGVPAPENTAPVEAELRPPLIMADMPSKVTVRLARSGPLQSSAVTLYVNEKELDRRATAIGGGLSRDQIFTIPPLGPGRHTARIETPADSLPADNSFHFLIHVREKLPALCVGTKDDSFFLRTALGTSLSRESSIEVQHIEADRLAEEPLEAYACIFVCNALPLAGQEIARLEQAVRSGGLLTVFPGDRAAVADYEPWQCLPAAPSAVIDVPMSDRRRTLRWEQPLHPLLRSLRTGTVAPLVTTRRSLRWDTWDSDALVVSSGAEQPLLLCRRFGKGRVVLLSVSADRSWSDFPLSPFYLPLVHRLVQFGAGIGAFSHYLWAGTSLPLAEHIPEATRESDLTGPDGSEVPVRGTMVDGVAVLVAEDVTAPGIYTISTPDEPDPVPALAVNLPRVESNLTPIDPVDIPEVLGVENVSVAHDEEDLLRLIEEHRLGKTFGEHLLWLALLLAAVEFSYANLLAKATPKLSESLGIEASGKVRGRR